ncbi:MAG TPA: peptide ABC transporter substrate-binding protein [Clostridia bacterium]|jgi:oligopeptide transport system substrate-binding protein|nr:peptide ABC transporter substrate-binding protein [Clostridia bacterium]
MKKLAALFLAVAVLASVFAGCSSKTADVNYLDEYKSYFTSQISTLNPYTIEFTSDYEFIANIIDGLVETDIYGRYVPALAESWEKNEDTSVWTFHLRKDLYWVDSTGAKTEYQITAQDFVDGMRYVADPANAAYNAGTIEDIITGFSDYYYALVDIDEGTDTTRTREDVVATFESTVGVKALDEYTVQYTLTGPTPYFLSFVMTEVFLPVEQALLDEVGVNFGTGMEYMLYCGGYYISTWDRDKLLVLTKNENYWDAEQITIKKLSFEGISDSISTVEMFKRGDLAQVELSSEEMNSVRGTEWEQYVYLSAKTPTTFWYTFNFESRNSEFKAFVNNLNFRKALYHALDRVTISAVWEPTDPAFFTRYTLLPEGVMFDENGVDYTDYPALTEYKNTNPYDPAKAKEYFDAAVAELCGADGTINGATAGTVDMLPIQQWDADGKLPLDILYSSASSENEMKKAVLVKQMLEDAFGKENVNVILGYSNNSFSDEVWAMANWDLVDDSYGFRYADPAANLGRITTDGSLNDSMYVVPEYDALVSAAKAKYNIQERFTAFSEAEKWMLDNAMIIPFLSGGGAYFMTRIVPYTTPGGIIGMGHWKYKGAVIQETPVTTEQHAQLTEKYKADIDALSNG